MKKYINRSGKKCYILNNYKLSDSVEYEAAEYWYLRLYAISLEDVDCSLITDRKKYMILEYPSYTEINYENKVNDCIWSTPYLAYLFKKAGTKRYKTVSEIQKFYDDQIKLSEDLLDELENYRFYHMGISNYEKIKGSSYIEYKVSPRQPDKWKCYYIEEYFITEIDSLGLLNLSDPEGLHNYRYFPLETAPLVIGEDVAFSGKRFSSNVSHLIRNSHSKLCEYSNEVYKDMLQYQLYGIAFKIDIIGFTQIYNKIVSELQTLNQSGRDIAQNFVALLANIFETRMQEQGISQYIIEGDGLTGTIPLLINSENVYIYDNKLFSLLDTIVKIQNDIADLVSHIDVNICLRCSVTSGQYMYGKLSGLGSLSQGFSGEIMIILSRMDQCLQSFVQDEMAEKKKSIVLGVKNDLFEGFNHIFITKGFEKKLSQCKFRETEINAVILSK